ncbi:putative histone deacetylase complex subunit cti6 [Podospora australis]|uniref:Histone deacetylase complex subunit cti6 n=1 Tax=Podospora australis TaxID=1536484 RepID=A0AAN6X3L6_9PEZI|nr:putative histone deacetylase complex subunit cti6 [Podospora australis]
MAGIDPRRSSRARTTQTQSQVSSSASSLSGRPERSSRYFNKSGSPQKPGSSGSLSSEPPEDTITAEDPFVSRRRTRGQGEEREVMETINHTVDEEMANAEVEGQDEDEAVRCVCGNDEYPGPPPLEEPSKHGAKNTLEIDPSFWATVTDDTAGLFVQCDLCKVWQHGGCVGIMTDQSSPDEYFCEQCRSDLHRTYTASNGNVYSQYLPLRRQSRTSSRSASLNKDGARSPVKEKNDRSVRASSASQASKRRSTMNSREAGYDEDEALRKAIEASKEDATVGSDVPRRPKRGRSDSEEKQDPAKRQRTSSRSVSPPPDKADDSDDVTSGRNAGSKSRIRGGKAVPLRRTESKSTTREEKERQRLEAASKRKGRAERRRADGTDVESVIYVKISGAYTDIDSDPASEEMPLAARAVVSRGIAVAGSHSAGEVAGDVGQALVAAEPPTATQLSPGSPPTPALPGKTDAKKKTHHKRKGRNQYTRDDEASPARSVSRDIQKDEHPPQGGNKTSAEGGSKSHSRAKGGMSSKITMNDMKRRAAALLEFISRTQVELAEESFTERITTTDFPKATENPAGAVPPPNVTVTTAKGPNAAVPAPAAAAQEPAAAHQEKEFKELGCIEMMDSLTRRLVKWQQQYAG